MVERHNGLDTVLVALVDDVVVMLDAQLIDLTTALWQDARPPDGETELLEAHLSHEGYVLTEVMVVVNTVVEVRVSLGYRCGVTHAQRAPVLEISALALIGTRRRTPQEGVRKRLETLVIHANPFPHALRFSKAA